VVKSAFLLAGALVASFAFTGTAKPAPLTFATRAAGLTPEVSSNWSGYQALGLDPAAPETFSDVTATWTQPKVSCTSGRRDAVAFWVGLGGATETSQALEQLGTAAECNGSSTLPAYSAWWEIVPAASVTIPLKILPGDRMTGAVLVKGQTVTLSLKNLTRKTRFSKTLTETQPLDVTSAEWIAEAPSACSSSGRCSAIPLTNFGTVAFTNAAAIGNAHPGTISDPAWTATPVELIADGSGSRFFGNNDILGAAVGAVPGDISTDGRSFSVAWQQNLSAP
jgi:hypothetical protein